MSAETIAAGRASLGIEFGSTRIKACLVGENPQDVLATGSHDWENELVDGVWTYDLADVWTGVQQAVAEVRADVLAVHGVELRDLRAIGVSAMMHGYLAFDADDRLLTPFRTWRNTSTGPAAAELTELLGVNIPLRWSIAHLHQAVLDGEEHVGRIARLTTLAGYVHGMLTGRHVLGVGDASGMFPIDPRTADYDADLIARYDAHAGLSLRAILPESLRAGADAGELSAAGAALLDPSGALRPGAVAAPPEGDAGTGMIATNAIAPRTGNVSVGTSVFAMIVLDGPLTRVHADIDVVTTPAGDAVAMVHCNNGASELGAWASLFTAFAAAAGRPVSVDETFAALLAAAAAAPADAGGVLAYNQLSGEPVVGLDAGRPLVVRGPDSSFTLGTFARAQLNGVFSALAIGMRTLGDEGVRVERLLAHGGLFRTAGVAQRVLAAALDVPITVAETASEGGAWGIAVLAAYRANANMPLAEYLDDVVFRDAPTSTVQPDATDVAGFTDHLVRYERGLAVEHAAVTAL